MELSFLVAAISAVSLSTAVLAADATTGIQPAREFKIAHCCHGHPYPPYDSYCCHGSTVYVAPAYGVGAASVRGVSRRTSRRTSRRVTRRR